jgi:hypothetical protein
MTEGIFALAGVVIGAVLGIAGTALTERWRHSYIRRDARIDRQAATLREALDAYTEFVLAWSQPANTIALGGTVDILDPAVISGRPGASHQRLTAVIERVHIEPIRLRLGVFIETVMASIANGTVTAASIEAAGEMGTQVAADIGTEIRKLEAL